MKKAVFCILFLLFAALLTVIYMNRAFQTPASPDAREVRVVIKTGTPAAKIIASLHEHGIIRSPVVFKTLLYLKGNTDKIKAGEYAFQGSLTPAQVMERLVRGDIVFHKITIPEGLTLAETARMIAEVPFLSGEEFSRRARDPAAILSIDPEAKDLEGYLFPDTYFLTRDMSAGRVADMMTGRFARIFTMEWRDRAEALGFSVREIVTLASLIEKETGLDKERSLVSSVFHNRLEKNMLLQCDPTVIYAMKKEGVYNGRLLRADLSFDSPYNTYRSPWLPPGPIACPGRDAIRAALYPDKTPYYYFVSCNDGSHAFSKNMAEHNRMVRKYRR